jgi:Ca-activated chloride channel family protein
MGYELAAQHFTAGASNRVILCSDGVANVGATGPDEIRQAIRDYTAQGIYLTTVGFGMGDYNDYLMEQLADDGNGNYAYVDTLDAARRIFVENLTGTLQVIAKDAKIQVDFNPVVVDSYRLLGYENRDVADADFRNDRVDAGEVGAGHSVTALYEVVPTGQGRGTALTVRVRYAAPQGGEIHEIEQVFATSEFGTQFEAAAPSLQLAVAVAGFAEQLRGSAYAEDHTLADVLAIAQHVAPKLANDSDVQELVGLVERATGLRG